MTRLDLARVRHENTLVLCGIREGLTRSEIAERTGFGAFKVALVMRRLVRGGLL